jgi:hypothetical protein
MKNSCVKLVGLLLAVSLFPMCTAGSDKNMSFRRQQIEENYASRMSQLYAKAEREASKLNVTDRLLWLEFITGDETPYSRRFSLYTVGGGSGSLSFSTFTKIGDEIATGTSLVASSSESFPTKLTTLTRSQRYLQAHLADSYSLRQFAMFLLSDQSSIVFSDIADSRFQNRRLRSQARALLRIAERLHIEAREIGSERSSALAVMQRDKKLADNVVSAPVEQIQIQPQTVEPGVVSAINYSAKGSICMLEGVETILSEGDTISEGFGEGVKVVKIESEQVRFQKGRHTWVQKVGEAPSNEWK